MTTTLIRSIASNVLHECNQPLKPMINKSLVANAWVGSYRIRNPDEYLDQFPRPKKWPRFNELIRPPQLDLNAEPHPGVYYHSRDNIKYSPKKMWYVVKFIRGMNIDEAIKQCRFLPYKGAQITADVLEEAQSIAVASHNFKYKSDMWVQEAIASKGLVVKGVRRHARFRFGEVRYFYTHLTIKLREGEAPVHFYQPPKDGNDRLKDYYDELRSRKIPQGL